MRAASPRRILAAAVIGVVVLAASAWPASADTIPFSAVRLVIEFNSTDDDAGIVVFFDGEAWRDVRITGPDGGKILHVVARGAFRRLGLTEVALESEEPSLAEILAEFPEGTYTFRGTTVEGDKLIGTAVLSHDIPTAPTILTPTAGGTVDPANTVITWSPIPGLAGFQVIVEQDVLGVSLTIDLPASATSLKVPPEFLQPGLEYALEILAIGTSGNRTITETTFVTATP
jgi:hypothetical protein